MLDEQHRLFLSDITSKHIDLFENQCSSVEYDANSNQIVISVPWYSWIVSLIVSGNLLGSNMDARMTGLFYQAIDSQVRKALNDPATHTLNQGLKLEDGIIHSPERINNLLCLQTLFVLAAPINNGNIKMELSGQPISLAGTEILDNMQKLKRTKLTPNRCVFLFNQITIKAGRVLDAEMRGTLTPAQVIKAKKEILDLIKEWKSVAPREDDQYVLMAGGFRFTVPSQDVEEIIRRVTGEAPSLATIVQNVSTGEAALTEQQRNYLSYYEHQFPTQQATFSAYETLREQTHAWSHKSYPQQTITLQGTSFQVHDISTMTDPFFIHARPAADIGACIDKINDQRIDKMCASLVNQQNDAFFEHDSRLALVLAVDPAMITETNFRDVASASTDGYYNFFRRFTIVASYIEKLFKNSGITNSYAEYVQFKAALLALEPLRARIQQLDVKSLSTKKELEGILQTIETIILPHIRTDHRRQIENVISLVKTSLSNNELAAAEEQLAALVLGLNEFGSILQKAIQKIEVKCPQLKDPNFDRDIGLPFFQLTSLLDHYSKPGNITDEAEQFFQLFGRQGTGIVQELTDCLALLNLMRADRHYMNPIKAPHRILAETGADPMWKYNEINLDTRFCRLYVPAFEVKAILIHREAVNTPQNGYHPNFVKGLRIAQERGIPIVLR